MKGVNSKDNKSDPYDNSTNNSVVTMNANAVTSETQTSNSSDNAASSKNTQFPDNKQMPGNAPGSIGGFDMDADESCVLTINGGTVTINADGDGIDSNGYFYINGGTVYVEGPESNGNSALDYGISAVLGIDNKRQRIRQIKAVNTEQRFRVDRIAAGNQIDLIRVSGQQIDKILDLIDLLQSNFYLRHIRKILSCYRSGTEARQF